MVAFFKLERVLLSYWLVCECGVYVYACVCIFRILSIYVVEYSTRMPRVYDAYVQFQE